MRHTVLILLLIALTSFNSNRNEDEQKIVQKCFDLKRVMNFFQEKQIIILDNGKVSPKIKISINGQEVAFMTEKELTAKGIKAFIVFHKFDIKKDLASVYFRLDSEGMGAEIELEKQKSDWKVISEKVYEN
ncbi:hypothetical protein SAMN05444377_1233 [Flavobacterium fontis]|uniref:Lumazine-binding n=1 Tax=Flavobacterium fontis TaxID=1124188 RepID=A0A1M5EWA5_9FLAO|nr:hypothetical protein [Flavobacterium fontis]SHF83520.1 hypothetical protein SAMN05444377_1233 [Flavobacterium fontis]